MAIEVEELYGRGRSPDAQRRAYLVTGTDSPTNAEVAALAAAPTILGAYSYREASSRELPARADLVGAFEVSVTWTDGSGVPAEEIDGSIEYAFRIQPASYRVMQSRETVSVVPDTAATRRFGGAINVDSELNVQGTQWPPPAAIVLDYKGTYDASRVTQAYFRQLCLMAEKINNATFEGFASGELLCLGASGRRRGNGPWQVSHSLGFSENRTNLSVGDLVVPSKRGWDYLWAFFEVAEHSDGSNVTALVTKPVSAYVERIGEYADFALLDPP